MSTIKICGVCRPEDAALAREAGADWIGVILAPGRSRSQSATSASAIFEASDARRVGVFVDPGLDDVARSVRELSLDAVQLHGDESPAFLRRILDAHDVEVWKAVRVREPDDITEAARRYADAHALLLDGFSDAGRGGVGASFDWVGAASARRTLSGDQRIIVAGGLHPGNVARAIETLEPDGVDVSSGVEEAVGRKSADRVRQFISAARSAFAAAGEKGAA